MLVERMNRKEIKMEVLNDHDTIFASSTIVRLATEYYRERNKLHIKKEAEYHRCYEFKTKSKNNWIISLFKDPDLKKIQKIEDCSCILYTYYYAGKNISVIRVAPSGKIEFYYAHLFSRYRERMGLDIPNLLDVVKYYLRLNADSWNRKLPDKDGQIKVIGTLKGGFQLGEYDKENQCDVFKTFIPFATANLLTKADRKETISKIKLSLLNWNPIDGEDYYKDMIFYLDILENEEKK